MSLNFLLHPNDREWFAYGIEMLIFCVWVLVPLVWRRWSFPAKKAKLLAKNPTFEAEIDKLFAEYQAKRFSNLGKATWTSWATIGFVMITLGYVTDTKYEFQTFHALLYVLCAAMILAGLHTTINGRLYDVVNMIEEFSSKGFDLERFKSSTSEPIGKILFAALFIGPALYLLSCMIFKYPYDLYHLALIFQKWDAN